MFSLFSLLITSILITTVAILSNNLLQLILLTSYIIVLNIINSKTRKIALIYFSGRFIGIVAVLFLLQIIMSGNNIDKFFSIAYKISSKNLIIALKNTIRFFLFFSSASLMFKRNFEEILQTMHRLKVNKVLIVLLSTTIYYVKSFSLEISSMIESLNLREISISEMAMGERMRVIPRVMTSLLGRTLSRTRFLTASLELRGIYNSARNSMCSFLILPSEYAHIFLTLIIIFLSYLITI